MVKPQRRAVLSVDKCVAWHDFQPRHPLFAPLSPWHEWLAGFTAWPDLADYQRLLDCQSQPIVTAGGKALRIVFDDRATPQEFADHYAPRIYLTGEIATRRHNWHDLFQFLSWLAFPATKALINSLHLPHARHRLALGERGRRSPIENMLSLFDEGGAVVLSSDTALLELIRDHQWHALFWQQRAALERHLSVIVFGHALYEKGLRPYVGMTANCLLLEVSPHFHTLPWPERLQQCDRGLRDRLAQGDLQRPRDLQPLPLLGMPGWDEANQHEGYYQNRDYFRPPREGR
jgi:hypothetical protein